MEIINSIPPFYKELSFAWTAVDLTCGDWSNEQGKDERMSSTNNLNRSIDLIATNLNPVKRILNTLHRIRSKKSEEVNFSATFTALPENEKAQFLNQIFDSSPNGTFKDYCKVCIIFSK